MIDIDRIIILSTPFGSKGFGDEKREPRNITNASLFIGLVRAGGAGAVAAATTGTGARDVAAAQTNPSPARRCCKILCGATASLVTIPANELCVSVPERF